MTSNRGVDPTQRGDETAEKMRAYFEAHKHDRWREGEADNLMLGLLNIVVAEYGARATQSPDDEGGR